MIYLPQSVHAKLKAEATRRAVSMSEVACTAVAQFLAAEVASVPATLSASPSVVKHGRVEPVVTPQAPSASQSYAAAVVGDETFEVEE